MDAALRQVLAPSDSALVIRVDPYEFAGVAPPRAWNWLQARQDPVLNILARPRRGGDDVVQPVYVPEDEKKR